MFTGIVRERGGIEKVTPIAGGIRLEISAAESLAGLRAGDSVAVNGVCQTVVALGKGSFSVEVLEETLRRTTMGDLRAGGTVNLEPSLRPEDSLGGHLVSGHVDGVGRIRSRVMRTGDILFEIGADGRILAQIVERGSVAVDGVSLTVVAVGPDGFSVTLIPHTLQKTTLDAKRAGARVNLETDMIVKAVQRLLDRSQHDGGLTQERLRELGF
jgi:riboflavin synthase